LQNLFRGKGRNGLSFWGEKGGENKDFSAARGSWRRNERGRVSKRKREKGQITIVRIGKKPKEYLFFSSHGCTGVLEGRELLEKKGNLKSSEGTLGSQKRSSGTIVGVGQGVQREREGGCTGEESRIAALG